MPKLTHNHYATSGRQWLCILFSGNGDSSPQLTEYLSQQGWHTLAGNGKCYVVNVPDHWEETWKRTYDLIRDNEATGAKVALVASETEPTLEDIALVSQPVDTLNQVAESLWLIEALENNPIECHFQSIRDRNGKLFGYEAFARIRNNDGEVMSGGAIINASHMLNIQHLLDRHLHTQAVSAFTSANLTGHLCVNFIPGYIRKTSAYLEGLCEAVAVNNLAADRVVLDVTDVENIHDYTHLSNIISYCHGKGFKVAIDGLTSAASAVALIEKLKPDIAVIDTQLVRKMTRIGGNGALEKLAGIAHKHHCGLLVKRVETEEMFADLTAAGVDYFQGYLFSRPLPAGKIIQ